MRTQRRSRRLRLLAQARWRPDADTVETPSTVEIIVDLAGVGEDDFEVQLFEDAVVVGGHRQLPACDEDAIYHAAGIRQGDLVVAIDGAPVETAADVADALHRGHSGTTLAYTLIRLGTKQALTV